MFGDDGDPRVPLQTFFAVHLTASAQVGGTWFYEWTQQNVGDDGVFVDADSPISGTTTVAPLMVEINNQSVATPSYAWARLRGIVDGEEYYEFQASGTTGPTGPTGPAGPPGSAGLSLALGEDFDPEPIIPFGPAPPVQGVNPIQVAGNVVSVLDASATQDGTVSTAAQFFAGHKTFNDGATASEFDVIGGLSGVKIDVGVNGSLVNYMRPGTYSYIFSGQFTDPGLHTASAGTVILASSVGSLDQVALYLESTAGSSGATDIGRLILLDTNPGAITSNPPCYAVGTIDSFGNIVVQQGVTGTGGGGDTFAGGICILKGSGASLTVGSSPVISGTNGSLFIESAGVLQQVTPAALDSLEATAVGAIADGTYGG